MATDTLVGNTIPGWIKSVGVGAAAFAVCWAGAIAYWRAFDRMPSTVEMALALIALPIVLILGFWAGHGLLRRGTAAPAAASPAAAKASSAPVQAAPLAILAASLRSPHGASPEELAQAIAANKARPDLDPELVDADGFPVMTTRCDDAQDDGLRNEINEWLAQNGIADLLYSDEQWRALTLATAVVGELASVAASQLIPASGTPPMLQLMPLLPAGWRIAHHRATSLWLKHIVAQFGWPPEHIRLPAELAADPDAGLPSAIFGRLAKDAAVPDTPLAAIVVGCASHIGDGSVAEWAANGSLFTSANPKGAIPGEGAAGLLVTDLLQARSLADAPVALLGNVNEARLASSADDARRLNSSSLRELSDHVLSQAGIPPSTIEMVVADTGHRANRTLELMGLVSARMQQLDGTEDVMRVGVATGACGSVPLITALALARDQAIEKRAPVLVIGNEDPYLRVGAVVRHADFSS
jgi:hypothetical protein